MLAVALAFLFWPRQLARGAVLINRFVLRRDVTGMQVSLERRMRIAGWASLVIYVVWLVWEIVAMLRDK